MPQLHLYILYSISSIKSLSAHFFFYCRFRYDEVFPKARLLLRHRNHLQGWGAEMIRRCGMSHSETKDTTRHNLEYLGIICHLSICAHKDYTCHLCSQCWNSGLQRIVDMLSQKWTLMSDCNLAEFGNFTVAARQLQFHSGCSQ